MCVRNTADVFMEKLDHMIRPIAITLLPIGEMDWPTNSNMELCYKDQNPDHRPEDFGSGQKISSHLFGGGSYI